MAHNMHDISSASGFLTKYSGVFSFTTQRPQLFPEGPNAQCISSFSDIQSELGDLVGNRSKESHRRKFTMREGLINYSY